METPNFDRIDPRQCVNGKLRRLHRMVDNLYASQLRSFGLRGSMLSMLFIIGKVKQVNQKFLANRLVLDASTVSRDLLKMKGKGWVHITKGDDGRESVVELTTAGYEFLEEVSPIWEGMHTKVHDLLGSFSIEQIDAVITKVSHSPHVLKG